MDVRRRGDQALVMTLCQSLYSLCGRELCPRMVVVVVAIEHGPFSEILPHVSSGGSKIFIPKVLRCVFENFHDLSMSFVGNLQASSSETYFFERIQGIYSESPRYFYGKFKIFIRNSPQI